MLKVRKGWKADLSGDTSFPMTRLLTKLHPGGWTDRKTYWLAIGLGAAAMIALASLKLVAGVPSWAIGAAASVLFVLMLLLTIRRLRDAGLSVWLALLVLFPLSIAIDVGTFTVSAFSLQFIDLAGLVRSLPILLGLALPSQPAAQRMIKATAIDAVAGDLQSIPQ